jgi:hypothetical protein
MSSWGTGIKQSDEFMDVYEEFFELYKDDAVAKDVYRSILEEYQSEFNDEESSPMLYTVYYALAHCLWECGEKDEWLWQKIKCIIDSDADLKFWDELGVEPKLKKSRKKQLEKFWEKINSAPEKIKKPKKTAKKREPTLHKGDMYAYACENGYRAALVLDYVWESYLTAITEEIFDHIPTEAEVMAAYTNTLTWFPPRQCVPKKDRTLISHIEVKGNYNNRAGLLFTPFIIGCSNLGERKFFYDTETAKSKMERNKLGRYLMSDLLNPEILPKYEPRLYLNIEAE